MIIKDTWYDAIKIRHSVRTFKKKSLPEEVLKALNDIVDSLNSEDKGYRLIFINEQNESIFKGIVGGYGKITSPPAFCLIIEDTEDSNTKEKMGYYGEAFILEATTLGLGTCWVSGTFDKTEAHKYLTLKAEEKINAIIPVGYADKSTFSSKALKTLIRANKRKSIQKLCINYKETFPDHIMDALESARYAPSAANSQSWRFTVEDHAFTVSINSNTDKGAFSKRHDAGIAMLHAEVALKHNNKKGAWKYLQTPNVAKYEF